MAKAKMKTKKSAAKRFKVTGSGKVMHRRVGMNHLLSNKPSHRKRRLNMDAQLEGADAANVKQLIPYK
jgi:large subunit ribosomal protein L35